MPRPGMHGVAAVTNLPEESGGGSQPGCPWARQGHPATTLLDGAGVQNAPCYDMCIPGEFGAPAQTGDAQMRSGRRCVPMRLGSSNSGDRATGHTRPACGMQTSQNSENWRPDRSRPDTHWKLYVLRDPGRVCSVPCFCRKRTQHRTGSDRAPAPLECPPAIGMQRS